MAAVCATSVLSTWDDPERQRLDDWLRVSQRAHIPTDLSLRVLRALYEDPYFDDDWCTALVPHDDGSVELTPGIIDEQAHRWYLHGQCVILALYLYLQSGWPPAVIIDPAQPGPHAQLVHVLIRLPDGRLLDIDGPHTDRDALDYWDTIIPECGYEIVNVPSFDALRPYVGYGEEETYSEIEHALTEDFAARLLREHA